MPTMIPMHPLQNKTAVNVSLIATFAALMIALGYIPKIQLAGVPVPITAQSMGVLIAGALLGWRRATLSMCLFLGLVALGLPFLAGGRGGLSVFLSPSGGYLLGFIAAAGAVGYLVQRRRRTNAIWLALSMLVGGVLIHLLGIAGMCVLGARMSLPAAFTADLLFWPGDLIKTALAAIVCSTVLSASAELRGLLWGTDHGTVDEVSPAVREATSPAFTPAPPSLSTSDDTVASPAPSGRGN